MKRTIDFSADQDLASYQLLVEGAEDYAIFMLSATGHIQTWNIGAERIKGYIAAEIIGKHFSCFYPSEDVRNGKPDRILQQARKAGRYEEDGWRVRKDGARFWACVVLTALYDPSGEVTGFVKVTRDMTERKRHEDALRAVNETLETRVTEVVRQNNLILGHSLDLICTLDAEGKFIQVSAACEKILGYQPEELLGKHFLDFVHEADHEASARRAEAILSGQPTNCFENRFVRKDGTPVDLMWSSTWSTEAQQFFSIGRDITHAKTTQRELQRSEEAFRATFEQVAIGISYTALDGTMHTVNQRYCEIVGYSREELKRLTYLDITHPDDRQVNEDHIRQMLAGEVARFSIEKRFIRKNRQVVWVELTSTLKRHPITQQPESFIAVIQDITQRKRIEGKLRQAEAHFRLLVESTEDYAIIRLDKYGHVASWNPGAEKTLGFSEKEILGQHFSRFYTPEDSMNGEPQRKLCRTIREGRAENERWHLRKDGTRFWGNGIINAIYDDAGNVQGFVKIMRDFTDRKIAEDRSHYLAHHDSLTGLPNRTHFSGRLHDALAHAQRALTGVALMLLDLDRFKTVNDTLGHDIGDLLLKEVATRLLTCVRETDMVARLGGDEFVIIQTNVMEKSDASTLAQKLLTDLGRPYLLNGQEVRSGASIGITFYPGDGHETGQLLKNADLALYQAKEQGRYNYQFYSEDMQAAIISRQQIEQDLRHALENQEFSLVYQPQIDLGTWQVSGVEALLRWRNPRLQLLAPAMFLELAQEMGLIVPIGEWVLAEACKQNKAWQDAGIPPFRISVNISARELEDPKFIGRIKRILAQTGLNPAWLEIEITEGQLIKDREATLAVLASLQAMNICIAADDFGNGLSNLKTLKRFPVDKLKIDRTVIEHAGHNRHDSAIAAAIIKLGGTLDIRVVAEGVETLDQLAFLRTEGCATAQGYLFTPPLSAHALAVMLREGNWSRRSSADSSADAQAPKNITGSATY